MVGLWHPATFAKCLDRGDSQAKPAICSSAGSSVVLDDLDLNSVIVVEVEAPSGHVVGVIDGIETLGLYALLGGVKVVDHDGPMIETSLCRVA